MGKKETMVRKASENKYLHRDFHISMKMALDYCHALYGDDDVKQYLRQFSQAYFKPLAEQIHCEGLPALKEYFEQIYAAEEAGVKAGLQGSLLTISIPCCPAIAYLKKSGHEIPPYYDYTTTIVYDELCRMAGIGFYLDEYDHETGKCSMRFIKEGE